VEGGEESFAHTQFSLFSRPDKICLKPNDDESVYEEETMMANDERGEKERQNEKSFPHCLFSLFLFFLQICFILLNF
jgi:hypothetical protein